MKFLNSVIHTNVFLSLAAVILTISAQVQLGMAPQWHPYLLLIFFATLTEYNRHRINFPGTRNEKENIREFNLSNNNQNRLLLLFLISIAGFICAAFITKTKVLLSFLPLAVLTLFYSIPGLSNRYYLIRLREVPYLKIFLIAFVWSASTILLPVIGANGNLFDKTVIMLFSERFLFIFAIAIPFDIRDLAKDRISGLKTIPMLISQKKALIPAYLALTFFLIISIIHYQTQQSRYIIYAMLISLLTTTVFLNSGKLRNFGRFYYHLLDGTLVFQGILVLTFYIFHQI